MCCFIETNYGHYFASRFLRFQIEVSILFVPNTFGPLFDNLHFLLLQIQVSILQNSDSGHNVICSLPYCNHYLVFALWSLFESCKIEACTWRRRKCRLPNSGLKVFGTNNIDPRHAPGAREALACRIRDGKFIEASAGLSGDVFFAL